MDAASEADDAAPAFDPVPLSPEQPAPVETPVGAPVEPLSEPLPAPTRRRLSRRARLGWVLGVSAAVLLSLAGTAVHVWANSSFDAAASALHDAAAAADAASASLAPVTDDAAGEVLAAQGVLVSATDGLVDTTARDAFGDRTAELAAAVDGAQTLVDDHVEIAAVVKPAWTWQILGEIPTMDAAAVALADEASAMHDAASAVEDTNTTFVDAALALYASVPAAAATVEAANISARNYVLLDFRDAAEAVAGQTQVGSGAANAFRDYAAQAVTLAASTQSELAEKVGPLYDTRLEIEAYARSIAGGVVLDFDWAPIVIGVGGADGMAGTATWNTIRGGFSTITLSDSVAENWPSDDARALVAHEVGHAITSKCSDKFDSEDQAANEAWATAWAISIGHTAEGNGTQAYGYPGDDMIAAAATCR